MTVTGRGTHRAIQFDQCSRRVDEKPDSRTSDCLCVGHVDCNLRRHLDLDRYTTVANEIPEKPERDRTRSAGFPHAFLSLQFVARISFPGARHRIDGLFPGYPGSFARRPNVASAADSAFLWVQTQYHSHPEFYFRRAFISSRFIRS